MLKKLDVRRAGRRWLGGRGAGLAGAASAIVLLAAPGLLQAQVHFAEYGLTTGTLPQGIAAGPDGAVWFAEEGSASTAGYIGRIAANGTVTQWALPAGNQPQQIAAGTDGNLYFTPAQGNYIGQITPSGTITQFAIPTAAASPTAIAVDSSGTIWFAEAAPGVNAILSVSTAGVFGTAIAIPTPNSIPTMMTKGPDGNIWFTEQCPAAAGCDGTGRIGTVRSGAVTEYTVPTANAQPFGITSGPDGALWFTELNGNKIGRITTGGAITESAALTANAEPVGITTGADGALWFTEAHGNNIGRITTSMSVTPYPIPTPSSEPYGIVEGPDRSIWFTEGQANQIGRLTSLSFETFQSVPGALASVSVGADGSVWGLNAEQQIYTYDFANNTWTNIPGALAQLSVGANGSVWGINQGQQIYHYNGSGWTNVPGSLTQISVGADGAVWGLNAQQNIYFYNGSGWTQVQGSLTSIAVGSAGAVYGLNGNGSLYWYNPGTGYFQFVPGTVNMTQVAVGADGDVWATNGSEAFHYDVLHSRLDAAPGASIQKLFVGSGALVFGLDASDNVWQWDATSSTWVELQGTMATLGAGANGTVWGVNSSQQIFQLGGAPSYVYQGLNVVPNANIGQISVGVDGTVLGIGANSTLMYFNKGTQQFQAVSGAPSLTQVSVGAGPEVGSIWGVNCPSTNSSACTIYSYDSASGTWTTVPGELNVVQVGADNSVWGLNASGQIYQWSGSGWTNIPGQLGQISIGADGTVWGINGGLQVYRYSSGGWVNVPGSLQSVSVGNANTIWGINVEGQIYTYTNSGWQNIPGTLTEIWASFDGSVWGVNGTTLYRWNGQSFVAAGTGVTQAIVGNAVSVWATNATSGATYMWF